MVGGDVAVLFDSAALSFILFELPFQVGSLFGVLSFQWLLYERKEDTQFLNLASHR